MTNDAMTKEWPMPNAQAARANARRKAADHRSFEIGPSLVIGHWSLVIRPLRRATLCRSCRRGAFTLLELLIAVAIFAIVLTAMNGVFYAAMRLQRSGSRMVEESVPIQQAVSVIKRDIQGIVAPGGTLAGPLQPSTAATGNAANMVPQG